MSSSFQISTKLLLLQIRNTLTDDIDSFAEIPKNPNSPLSEKNKKLKSIALDAKDFRNFKSIEHSTGRIELDQ